MNKIGLAAITGAALVAVAGVANAQGTGTSSGSSGTASNFCWDVSSNMVRDKNQTNAGGTSNASGTSSANASSTTGSVSPKRAVGTGTARPAGMPDC